MTVHNNPPLGAVEALGIVVVRNPLESCVGGARFSARGEAEIARRANMLSPAAETNEWCVWTGHGQDAFRQVRDDTAWARTWLETVRASRYS
jgi:hypothetical protein